MGGVGVACRRAKEAAKKFCVVANFSAYFAHKTEAAFHFPPLLFRLLLLLLLLLLALLPTSCMSRFVSVFISAPGSSFLFF